MSGHDNHHDEVDDLKWPDPLGPEWICTAVETLPGHEHTLSIEHSGNPVTIVSVKRVVDTNFGLTYPSGLLDRILILAPLVPAEAIQLASEFMMDADPACRRLIIACEEGDVAAIGVAEAAGYRYVVDVDLHSGSYALLTAEPDWVLEESRNIDEVPTV